LRPEALEERSVPTASLAPVAFSVVEDRSTWGSDVLVRYALANQGSAPSGPFRAQFVLSRDDVIDAADPALGELSFAGLAPGQSLSGRIAVALPGRADAPPPNFPGGGLVRLGWRLVPGGPDTTVTGPDPLHHTEGVIADRLSVIQVAREVGSNDTPVTAQSIEPDATVSGSFERRGDVDYYAFTLTEASRVRVRATAAAGPGPAPLLKLFGTDGRLLVQSTGPGPEGAGAEVIQRLPAGAYIARMSASGGGSPSPIGGYVLTTEATSDVTRIGFSATQGSSIVTDISGDGRHDLIDSIEEIIFEDGNFITRSRGEVYLGNGDGTFQAPRPVGGGIQAVADLNGDGRPDLIGRGEVLLGNGDGTFQAPRPTGEFGFVAVTDLNGDGRPDLIGNVSEGQAEEPHLEIFHGVVLLGTGDGSFQPPRATGGGRVTTVTDLNADGRPDLIGANSVVVHEQGRASLINKGEVLLGNGDGTFQAPRATGGDWIQLVADVSGDGRPDLIGGDSVTGSGEVLLGNGDGTFQAPRPTGGGGIAEVADVNGDGRPDLTGNATTVLTVVGLDGSLSTALGVGPGEVQLGNGDGTFQAPRPTGGGGIAKVADVNGDGRPDLVDSHLVTLSVVVLLGNGDGTFQAPRPTGGSGIAEVADVNGDGRPDLIGSAGATGGVVMLGNGDGTFQAPRPGVGASQMAVDLNGDGRPDLVDGKEVRLGNGDGTFQAPRPAGGGFSAVADVNGDGRPDLIGEQYDGPFTTGYVVVLLGNGDGTFQAPRATGASGQVSKVADLNGDGRPDLIGTVTEYMNESGDGNPTYHGEVQLGNGDGTFQTPRPTGGGFVVSVADLNGDGRLDLAGYDVVELQENGYTKVIHHGEVLLGNGDGTFQTPRSIVWNDIESVIDFDGDGRPDVISVGGGIDGVEDVNGDARPDLISSTSVTGSVVMLGNGDGTFQAPRPTGGRSVAAAADLNGDGRPDLIDVDYANQTGSVQLGNGDGTFQAPRSIGGVSGRVVADVNGDGRPDLIGFDNVASSDVVLLGNGDGTFSRAQANDAVKTRSVPFRADFNRDGIPDVASLDGKGNILFRRGLAAGDARFAPPVLLNPGRPARDLVPLRGRGGWSLAAADASGDGVSFYAARPSGTFARTLAFTAGILPVRLAVADLNGDGRDDLVAAADLGRSLTVAFQGPDGRFTPGPVLSISRVPSEIVLADLDGRNGPDIAVAEQAAGQVHVFYNDPGHLFAASARFRAGFGPYGIDTSSGDAEVSSLEQTVALVADRFDARGRTALVAVNRGTNRVNTLRVTPDGLADPQPALGFLTSTARAVNDEPGQAVSADFDRDGRPDLAVLMEDAAEVWVYRGQGDGAFAFLSRSAAGQRPTGLSVTDVNRDGAADLLVGNDFGDVLLVLGNGDGTFRPFVRSDQRVPFVVTDLNGDGTLDVVLADQAHDQAGSLLRQPGAPRFTPGAFQRDGNDGLIGPGAVAEADLDGRFGTDLVFANSGSNNVLVYLRRPDGGFRDDPLVFVVGTNPVGLTVADLNGDARPDLAVADQGSNSVTVLLGATAADGSWTYKPGPRLATGGDGPNAVSVRDNDGDGVPDLFVTNGQSGTLAVLPGIGSQGVGTGFFRDTDLRPVSLGGLPVTQTLIPVGSPSGFAVTSSGGLLRFDVANLALPPVPLDLGRSVRAISAFTGDDFRLLATANADGTVSILDSADGVNFAEWQLLTSPVPGEPSALELLQVGNDFEVYVTHAGEALPVVLGFDGADPLLDRPSGPDVPGGIDRPDGGGVSSVPGAPLALAVTLLSTNPSQGEAPATDGVGDALSALNSGEATEVSVEAGLVTGVGDSLSEALHGGKVKADEEPTDSWTALGQVLSHILDVMSELGRLVGIPDGPANGGDGDDGTADGSGLQRAVEALLKLHHSFRQWWLESNAAADPVGKGGDAASEPGNGDQVVSLPTPEGDPEVTGPQAGAVHPSAEPNDALPRPAAATSHEVDQLGATPGANLWHMTYTELFLHLFFVGVACRQVAAIDQSCRVRRETAIGRRRTFLRPQH
jgi:hypothetical protein